MDGEICSAKQTQRTLITIAGTFLYSTSFERSYCLHEHWRKIALLENNSFFKIYLY